MTSTPPSIRARRQAFFAPKINFPPGSSASLTSATETPGSRVSAVSLPLKDSGPTHKKKKTNNDQEQDRSLDSDASNEIVCVVNHASKQERRTARGVGGASTVDNAEKSTNLTNDKTASAVDTVQVDHRPPRVRHSAGIVAAAVENDTDAGQAEAAKPRATRQSWSLSGTSTRYPTLPADYDTRRNKAKSVERSYAAPIAQHPQPEPVTPPPRVQTPLRETLRMNGKVTKRYMEAGFYCQDDYAKSPYKLVSKILMRREAEEKLTSIKPNAAYRPELNRPAFPPLPYDYGYELFFGEQHDFFLPFDIRSESENGLLDGKKKPAPYTKLRASK